MATNNARTARNSNAHSAHNTNTPGTRNCPVRQSPTATHSAAAQALHASYNAPTVPLNYAMAYAGATSPQATPQQKAAFALLQQHIAAIVAAGGKQSTCTLYNMLCGRNALPQGVQLPGNWRKMQNSVHLRAFVNAHMAHIATIGTAQHGKRKLTHLQAANS